MTKEERELAITYLEEMKESYIEGVGYERHPLPEYYAIETAIKSLALPSITPQEPKTGHWIDKQHLFNSCSAECSSCHKRSNGYVLDNGFSLEFKYFDFCPNCGARMVDPQESEDKE